MKANKVRNFFTADNLKSQLVILYVIALALSCYYLFFVSPLLNNDTPGYFSAGENFTNGQIDILRMPVYPMVCYFFRHILNLDMNASYNMITVFQIIVFMLSIVPFFRLVKRFVKSNLLCFIACLLYIICCVGWTRTILTESLAISGSVFLLYCVAVFLKKRNVLWGFYINLITFLLLMLRPAFLYLLPLVFVFWLYLLIVKHNKQNCFVGLGGIVVVIVLFLGYCQLFKQTYGIFAPSEVSVINQHIKLKSHHLFSPETAKDSSIVYFYDNVEGYIGDNNHLLEKKYGLVAVNEMVTSTMRQNKREYLIVTLKQIFILPFLAKRYVVVYSILIAYFVGLLYGIVLRRTIPILSIFMWCFITGMLLTIFLSIGEDVTRLFMPAVPFTIIALIHLIGKLSIKINDEPLFEE